MKSRLARIFLSVVLAVGTFSLASCASAPEMTGDGESAAPSGGETPVSRHGSLRVVGADLCDSAGEKYQLYGMSTHGIAWFPQFVNEDAFKSLRDDWNVNCVRIAVYTAENGGYCNGGDQEQLKTVVKNGVDFATGLGLYVIIDWHILKDRDPSVYKDDALSFFREMSELYKDNDNVLYEICNEPNTTATWDQIKTYAEEVIPVIRENDADAVVIVGTPTWSQDIDKAAALPLDFDNVMYALHFYAGTHKDQLRQRAEKCVKEGLPVFISEFGICDASGNGGNDTVQARKWMDLIDKYNISYICWNLSDNPESSAVIAAGSAKTSGWILDDLKDSGKWVFEKFKNEENP